MILYKLWLASLPYSHVARLSCQESLATRDPCVRIKLTFMSSIFNADHTSVLSTLATGR